MPAPAFGSSRRSGSVDRGSRWTPRPVASPRPLHSDLPRPADARGRRWREPGVRAKCDAITRIGQSRGRDQSSLTPQGRSGRRPGRIPRHKATLGTHRSATVSRSLAFRCEFDAHVADRARHGFSLRFYRFYGRVESTSSRRPQEKARLQAERSLAKRLEGPFRNP